MPDDKKIIIDEDWKAQVQAEKQAAGEPASAGGTKTVEPNAGSGTQDPSMPASFEMLVTTLATEALAALGQFPHPVTGKAEVQRHHAQYLIDTLDVLREKCKGNLTPAEQQLLESVLHQLRMLFIAVADQPAAAAE